MGATSIFIMEGAAVDNKCIAVSPLKINLPDGKKIQSTQVCDINIPGLPTTLTGHIVPSLTIAPLISIRPLCKAGCRVTLSEVINSHILVAPRILVGLLGLRGLTCCSLKGLAIAVIATAVQDVMRRGRTAMGLALLAKLLTATPLRDSTSRPPGRFALRVTLGFGRGCTALCLCLEVHTLIFFHDSLDGLQVR